VTSLNSIMCVLCVVLPPHPQGQVRKTHSHERIPVMPSGVRLFLYFGLPFLQRFCVRTEFAIGLHPEFGLQSLVTSLSHHANREASCSVGSRP
jgi:hypothetical protein